MTNSPNTNAKKTSAPDFIFIIKILSTLLIKREVHNININNLTPLEAINLMKEMKDQTTKRNMKFTQPV